MFSIARHSNRGAWRVTVLLLLLCAVPRPALASGEVRVLFIGNSLTAANDLAAMVQAIAESSGWRDRFRCERVTRDNFSLEDHWAQGEARRAIARGGWTHIVLQQGPSSLPSSQRLLSEYARKFAVEIRAIGARPVLYGVWPPKGRLAFQDAVTDGYVRAAADAGGVAVPTGAGWTNAWRRDPELRLYGPDDFHPSPIGSFLAALMLFEALSGAPPADMDRAIRTSEALESVKLSAQQLKLVQEAAVQGAARPRTIAITIDDLPTASVLGDDITRAETITGDLLAALHRAQVPAIGFVNEGKLHTDGLIDPRRVALLQAWIDAGLELGNHTYSHIDLHRTDVETFIREVDRGDVVVRRLLAPAGRQPRYFRHPFLRTGERAATRDKVSRALAARGYLVAPVTVDNYDYVFAAAYDRARAAGNEGLAARIREAYLDYMDSMVRYYEDQAVTISGRDISQTLLMHASALNAATVEELIRRLRGRGYRFVSLDEALKDTVYASRDAYFGAGGISWLHRWAMTQGLARSTFRGEPEVPAWVQRASEAR